MARFGSNKTAGGWVAGQAGGVWRVESYVAPRPDKNSVD